MRFVAAAAAAVAVVVLGLILAFLLLESWPALTRLAPGQWFTDPSWHASVGHFNLTPMIVGSLVVTTGALLVAIPLGVLSAVFVCYYAPPKVAGLFGPVLALLGAVPSVVFGLWGLVCVAPLIAQVRQPGASLLAGIVVLALMILPTVAITTKASLEAVPVDIIHAGTALGFRRGAIVTRLALPKAGPGVTAGVVLAGGRAIGETMAVLMVTGNAIAIPHSLFDSGRTLTANIALEMAYALDLHRSALFVSGLVIALLVGAVLLLKGLWPRRKVHVDVA